MLIAQTTEDHLRDAQLSLISAFTTDDDSERIKYLKTAGIEFSLAVANGTQKYVKDLLIPNEVLKYSNMGKALLNKVVMVNSDYWIMHAKLGISEARKIQREQYALNTSPEDIINLMAICVTALYENSITDYEWEKPKLN